MPKNSNKRQYKTKEKKKGMIFRNNKL